MLRAIVLKELREMAREGRLRLLLGIGLALLGAALVLGVARGARLARARDEAVREGRATWLGQAAKNPHNAAHFGVVAVRPVSALAAVVPGVVGHLPPSALLVAHVRNDGTYLPGVGTDGIARLEDLDVAEVATEIAPLCVLLLVGLGIAVERTHGTLRLIQSTGVSAWRWTLGKALAVAVVAAAPGFLLVLTGLLAGTFVRSALVGFGYLLYLGGFVGVGTAVAVWARRPLVPLVALWAVLCVVVPRAAMEMALRCWPILNAAAFERDVREAEAKGPNRDGFLVTERRAFVARYGQPSNAAGIAIEAGEERSDRAQATAYKGLWTTVERQEAFRDRVAAFDPPLAFSSFATGLAGTDAAHAHRFDEAAEAYRQAVVRTMNEDLARHAGRDMEAYRADRRVFASVPPFRDVEPSVEHDLRAQARNLALLALWCVGGAALALGSLPFREVR